MIAAAGLLSQSASASPNLEARYWHVKGTQLRLIVETTIQHSSIIPDTPRTTSDAKGWLLVVDLSSSQALGARSVVVGPLWDTPNPHTGFDGLIFTKADQEAAKATPFVAFDSDGNVMRIKNGHRCELILEQATARWVDRGAYVPPPEKIPFLGEDLLRTASKRYELRRDPGNGRVTLYETLTGARVPNEWVTNAFSTYRTIPDIDNTKAFVSEGLDCLVCFPHWIWNKGFGKGVVSDFQVGGHSYKRADYLFWFHPPSREPIVIHRPQVDNTEFDGVPSFMVMVNNQPWMFYNRIGAVRLQRLDGPEFFEAKTASLTEWPQYGIRDEQHLPEQNCIAMFYDNRATLHTYIWNYQSGKIAQYDTSYSELFWSILGSEYRPKGHIEPLESK
ncbi:MAG TPA: hypothetical protein PLU52_00750 [Opitutaceae bacterium]|nr:hypothetical protein [Opitutaceae bacterium]HND61618.1 hypothetical protein [Opitutaceae bacterium]